MLGREKMNKRMVIAITIIVVVIVAAVAHFSLTQKSKELPTSVESVGGEYNVTLSYFNGYAQIAYADETGNHSGMYFAPQMRSGLDWIKNNTPANATFLCWWDYGHMIKGYAERNVIVRNTSHEWIDMVADKSSVTEFDPNQRLVDVAEALTTSNSSEAQQIMEEYGATYVVAGGNDTQNTWWIYSVAGLEPRDYHEQLQNGTWVLNASGKQGMIAKLQGDGDTGFTLVYEDVAMKVYKKE